jgi:glycosyltransferase involved in cell wall biosynthesis
MGNRNNRAAHAADTSEGDRSAPSFHVSVVVPVFEEAQQIGQALTRVSKLLRSSGWESEVLVVDDGSDDGTSEAAARWKSYIENLNVVRHGERKGRGTAVRTGALLARGRHVVIVDPRGDTPMEDALHLVDSLDRGADVAIASRKVPGAEIQMTGNFLERASETTFTALSKMLVPIGARETNSDLTAIRRSSARLIAQRARVRGDAWPYEWLALATRLGLNLVEAPVSWRDYEAEDRRGRPNELVMLHEVWKLRGRLRREEGPKVAAAHDLLHETGFVRIDRRVLLGSRAKLPQRKRSA